MTGLRLSPIWTLVVALLATPLFANETGAPFWTTDFAERFGDSLVLQANANDNVYLCRNEAALQLHGGSVARQGALRVEECLFLPADIEDLSRIAGAMEGDLLLLRVPVGPAGNDALSLDADAQAATGVPLLVRASDGQSWMLLNLHSNGEGQLLIELEGKAQNQTAGAYLAGAVRHLRIERKPAQ